MRSCKHRSFAVYSFGKTLHITGWRVGYCVAPPVLTRELRKVHQFNAFSIAAPLQAGHPLYLQRHPDAWREVAAFFSAKRDLLRARLAGSGLDLPPAAGTYFQLADYSTLGASSPPATTWNSPSGSSTRPASRSSRCRRSTASRPPACASCGCASPSAMRR